MQDELFGGGVLGEGLDRPSARERGIAEFLAAAPTLQVLGITDEILQERHAALGQVACRQSISVQWVDNGAESRKCCCSGSFIRRIALW